ncbi:MAG: gamma-glutamylcyclotransferase [Candidatus Saliniplasma sp.]
MPKEMVDYFAYGSNLYVKQMEKRGVKIYDSEEAKLPGWKLAFTYRSNNRDGGVLDIIPGEEDDLVVGIIYKIDNKSLERLDIYEGREVRDNKELGVYRRQFVPLFTKKGCRTALTYVVNRVPEFKNKAHFPPSDDYLDTVVKGAEEHGLSQDYIEMLKNIETK